MTVLNYNFRRHRHRNQYQVFYNKNNYSLTIFIF